MNESYITKPDKDDGAVILYKHDYVKEMNVILGDTSKFRHSGPSETHGRTDKLEVKLQKRLLSVYKSNVICKDTYA